MLAVVRSSGEEGEGSKHKSSCLRQKFHQPRIRIWAVKSPCALSAEMSKWQPNRAKCEEARVTGFGKP